MVTKKQLKELGFMVRKVWPMHPLLHAKTNEVIRNEATLTLPYGNRLFIKRDILSFVWPVATNNKSTAISLSRMKLSQLRNIVTSCQKDGWLGCVYLASVCNDMASNVWFGDILAQ